MADKKKLPFRIKRDRWDEDGVRHKAGKIVELSAEDALEALEAGHIERVKAEEPK